LNHLLSIYEVKNRFQIFLSNSTCVCHYTTGQPFMNPYVEIQPAGAGIAISKGLDSTKMVAQAQAAAPAAAVGLHKFANLVGPQSIA
jgi:hypothetical protein